MTSLQPIHPRFFQAEYSESFYYCDKNHPFVVFTTCYCPLCDAAENINVLEEDAKDLEDAFDTLEEAFHDLTLKVKNTNPELLI